MRTACSTALVAIVLALGVAGAPRSARADAAATPAPVEVPAADWNTQANSLKGNPGERFELTCPPNGTLSSRLWGTDLYTDDSSICTAAVHAELITTAKGGSVIVELRPGAASYHGSTRNTAVSRDYGSWTGSFAFVKGGTQSPAVVEPAKVVSSADWSTQPNSLHGVFGNKFTLGCPAGGTLSNRLWGTDHYTDDSSICTAAVHAGLITTGKGGKVTIELLPGQTAYKGSTHNGVTSRDYGAWSGSFDFVHS